MLKIKKTNKNNAGKKKIYARTVKKTEPGKVYRISIPSDGNGSDLKLEITIGK